MKITTTGSLGNIAKPLVKKLIAADNDVTVITTNENRRAEIEALGAKAAVGSISDVAFLTEAFTAAILKIFPGRLPKHYRRKERVLN